MIWYFEQCLISIAYLILLLEMHAWIDLIVWIDSLDMMYDMLVNWLSEVKIANCVGLDKSIPQFDI
jgi:hypothetical protein